MPPEEKDNVINPPLGSKINATQIASLIVALITIWGVASPELADKIEKTLIIVTPIVTIILRSGFTGRIKKD